MTADEYKRRKDQQPIGGFKDPTGSYREKLRQLQLKFRITTLAELMKKLIDDALASESIVKSHVRAQSAGENMRKINKRRRNLNYWFLGFNLFWSFLLLYLMFR